MSKSSNDNCVNSEDYCSSIDNADEGNDVEFSYDSEPITEEYEYFFNLYAEMSTLEREKRELEVLAHTNINELLSKKSELTRLGEEIRVIQKKIDSPCTKSSNQIIDYKTNQTSTKDIRLTRFIIEVQVDFPKATSKDILAHCFNCYEKNSRKKRELKKIMLSLGIKDEKSGKRTNEAIKMMEGAPIYKPT